MLFFRDRPGSAFGCYPTDFCAPSIFLLLGSTCVGLLPLCCSNHLLMVWPLAIDIIVRNHGINLWRGVTLAGCRQPHSRCRCELKHLLDTLSQLSENSPFEVENQIKAMSVLRLLWTPELSLGVLGSSRLSVSIIWWRQSYINDIKLIKQLNE